MGRTLKEQDGILLPLSMAEKGLRILRELKLVDTSHRFLRRDWAIHVPLLRELTENETQIIKVQIGDFRSQRGFFREIESKPKRLDAYLRGKIPDELISGLPRSFDSIGDIAVIELPESMEQFSAVIGRGIIETNPHIRLALRRSSQVEGPFRTRKFEVMAGVGGTETFYREFSCRFHLDVSTVYFSPRLSRERMRIAQQVIPDEIIVDMFAGVGPYSILIAKLQPKSTIYSVDINPAAVKYLRENAFANGVADRVIPMEGDVKELARKDLHGLANRVIMNLPSEAVNYLPAASQILKDEGGMVHFYSFAQREENINSVISSFRLNVEAQNRRIKSVRFCKTIKEVAPKRVEVAIDALLSARVPR